MNIHRTKEDLLKEWDSVSKERCFEIEYNGEHVIWNIFGDNKGLTANCDSHDFKDCFIRWDEIYPLDEHLQELYSRCLERMN